MNNKYLRMIMTLAVMITAVYAGNVYGLWYIAIITALITSCFTSFFKSLGLSLLSSLIAWGGVLFIHDMMYPLNRVASIVAGIIGIGTDKGSFIYAATLLLPIFYTLSGVYLGCSIRIIVKTISKKYVVHMVNETSEGIMIKQN